MNEQDAAQRDDFSFWSILDSSEIGSAQPYSSAANTKTVLPPSVAVARAMGVTELRFAGLLNGHSVTILVDSGAERDCASKQFLERKNIDYLDSEKRDVLIQLADGQVKLCGVLEKEKFQIGAYTDSCEFAVTDLKEENMILGMPWLTCRNFHPDWLMRTPTFRHVGKKFCIPAMSVANTPIPVVSAMEFISELKSNNPAWLRVIKIGSSRSCGQTNPEMF